MPEFTGVEIARTGTFALSTGEHTFTRAQLAAAVRNAEQGVAPRIGPGHIDPRFNGPEHDATPALGKVTNLRLAEDGDVLLGDYADMPGWLEKNLEKAYPGRSLEASVKGDDMHITRVKLLGLTLPGISNLKDLQRHLSDEGPLQIAAGEDNDGHRIDVIFASTEDAAARLGTMIAASGIDVDQLRSAYQEAHQSAPGALGPWVEEIYIDPNELIVRDGQRLWRVPWSWDDTTDRFEFGTATEVRVDYVDVAASAAPTRRRLITTPDSRRPDPHKGEHMTPKDLRAALKLPEDATDDLVAQTIAASMTASDTMQVVRDELNLAADATTDQVKSGLAEHKAVAASDAQVLVDRKQLEELQASAQLGASAHQTLADRDAQHERDTYLEGKVLDGTLHRDSVESYHEIFAAAGVEKAKAAIDAMPKGIVPVLDRIAVDIDDEIHASGPDGVLPDDGSVPEGLSLLTPAERAQRA